MKITFNAHVNSTRIQKELIQVALQHKLAKQVNAGNRQSTKLFYMVEIPKGGWSVDGATEFSMSFFDPDHQPDEKAIAAFRECLANHDPTASPAPEPPPDRLLDPTVKIFDEQLRLSNGKKLVGLSRAEIDNLFLGLLVQLGYAEQKDDGEWYLSRIRVRK